MQKQVNLVDLVKSFPTNIFLQNLASIQKRTSPVKFAHLAEKSRKGSISNLSTKPEAAGGWREGAGRRLRRGREAAARLAEHALALHDRGNLSNSSSFFILLHSIPAVFRQTLNVRTDLKDEGRTSRPSLHTESCYRAAFWGSKRRPLRFS